jgi:hypothetical protein
MDTGLAIAVFLALGFAATNWAPRPSNAIATLVATQAARPRLADQAEWRLGFPP